MHHLLQNITGYEKKVKSGPLGSKMGPVQIVCRFMETYIKTFNEV